MELSLGQCYLLAAGVMGAAGFMRGWSREIVTTAAVLGGVLALVAGGADALGRFIFVSLPAMLHLPGAPALSSVPPQQNVYALSLLALSVLTVASYIVGNRYGVPPTQQQHRLVGLALGALDGAVLVYFVGRGLPPGTSLALHMPSPDMLRSGVEAALGVGLAVVGGIAIHANATRKGRR